MPHQLSILPETLHIALATYPKGQSDKYIEDINDFYKSFRDEIKENYMSSNLTDDFYSPMVYHVFGSYDVAFITLVDNHKFSQKLFFPKGKKLSPNAFQILTGLCPVINKDFSLKSAFSSNRNKTYFCACNLKLGNGFLIGNGQVFLNSVSLLIDKKIKEIKNTADVQNCEDYILIQSFSWFEISLLIFSDNIDDISTIINQLRESKIRELEVYFTEEGEFKDFLNNSLYRDFYVKENKKEELDNNDIEKFKESHIFADSHSYFGIDYNKFKEKDVTDELRTEIEFQVKPGHAKDLLNELGKLKGTNGSPIFKVNEPIFLTGKSDFLIQEIENDKLSNNQILFRELRNPKSSIRKYIRGVKTRPLFKVPVDSFHTSGENGILNLPEYLKDLIIPENTIEQTDLSLKSLKVSRQIRQKIVKIFFNFNNGIQDTILFIYFLDFKIFMQKLIRVIEAESNHLKESFNTTKNTQPKSVEELEEILRNYINVFEEAHHNRVLNCYLFEEIYDFDLDFNSSIQQLLSTYNTVVSEATNLYYTKKEELPSGEIIYKKYQTGQVVQLNLKNTIANDISINYSVNHLTTPEFVFFTLDKEILNNASSHDDRFSGIIKNIEELVKNKGSNNLKNWLQTKKFLVDYYIIDVHRYITICNFDLSLFEYWFWSFNLQNPSLYNSKGLFDETHFHKELIRLIFQYAIFGKEKDIVNLKCPIPELQSYWERYFDITKREVLELVRTVTNEKGEFLSDLVKRYLKISDIDLEVSIDKDTKQIIFEHEDNDVNNNDLLLLLKSIGNNDFRYGPNRRKVFREFYTKIVDKIDNGNVELYIENDCSPTAYLYAIMYSYLRFLKEKYSNGKINILRRNWQTGKPMRRFIKENNANQLYNIDPMGGVFFIDSKKAEKFYQVRNGILQSLWHFSLIMKKRFITHLLEQVDGTENL